MKNLKNDEVFIRRQRNSFESFSTKFNFVFLLFWSFKFSNTKDSLSCNWAKMLKYVVSLLALFLTEKSAFGQETISKCCPKDQIFDLESEKCVETNLMNKIFDGTSFLASKTFLDLAEFRIVDSNLTDDRLEIGYAKIKFILPTKNCDHCRILLFTYFRFLLSKMTIY